MILRLDEAIDLSGVDKLIAFINESDAAGEDKDILYLMSMGGYYDHMQIMLDIINFHRDSILLIGFGILGSSAFELFMRAECEKEILPGTRGMFHQATIPIDMNESWKAHSPEDIATRAYMKGFMRERTQALCKDLQLTPKEMKELNSGSDVYFNYERMQELLKNVTSKQ